MDKLKVDFGVTALLATILVSGATAGSLYLIVIGEYALGIGFLSPAAMAAVGFYTGKRNKTP